MDHRLTNTPFATIACLFFTMSGMLVKSTVSDAIVVHQHGRMMAHFHLLGGRDPVDYAAESPLFGHQYPAALPLSSHRVRTIAIIATGVVYVPETRTTFEPTPFVDHWVPLSEEMPPSLYAPWLVDGQTSSFVIQPRKSSASSLLARNHVLLI